MAPLFRSGPSERHHAFSLMETTTRNNKTIRQYITLYYTNLQVLAAFMKREA